ncbi:MAG: hypothetical protein IKP15_07970 [Bacteroidales bacterium]|nr:hypothetical protein [Bacteroidales bacterium]
MSKRTDISTPEGYFDSLQSRLADIPRREEERASAAPKGIRRLAPYAAFAASIAVAVVLGNFILRSTAVPQEDNGWTYLSYLSQALDPDCAALVDEAAWEEEEGILSEEDIINYLLADGISVEHLNYVNYEEGY